MKPSTQSLLSRPTQTLRIISVIYNHYIWLVLQESTRRYIAYRHFEFPILLWAQFWDARQILQVWTLVLIWSTIYDFFAVSIRVFYILTLVLQFLILHSVLFIDRNFRYTKLISIDCRDVKVPFENSRCKESKETIFFDLPKNFRDDIEAKWH